MRREVSRLYTLYTDLEICCELWITKSALRRSQPRVGEAQAPHGFEAVVLGDAHG